MSRLTEFDTPPNLASEVVCDIAKKPNTFIVGAPKCGTTALCSYLSQHPSVFMSSPKEPHHYVGDEMPKKARRFGEHKHYSALFANVEKHHKVIAEGSVWYLYSQTGIQNIHQACPNANIIIMLRRPDEMVYSMHNMGVANFSEDIFDFDEAWRTALSGNTRKSWPKLCDVRSKLDYHRIALYSEQLERVYKLFDKSQVHVVFYDDFKSNTNECYQNVLEFLSVERFETDLKKINESKVVVNRVLGKFLRKPPRVVMVVSTILKRILNVKKLGVRDRLEMANTKVQRRIPMSSETRLDVIRHYKADIEKLSALCDRDLSHWLR